MEITKRLAEFVLESPPGSIPSEALEEAKSAIMDCLGVTLAGSREEIGRVIKEFVKSMGGTPTSSLIGGGFKTSAPAAALANGIMGHALDFDDIAPGLLFHPSVPVVPAILAVAEMEAISGRSILEAYVVGFEVETQACRALSHHHYTKGYHITATAGIMGATAAAARLLSLDPKTLTWAFGIAASEAGGVRQNFGSMTKPFHAGNAASGGVTAVLLAKGGYTASTKIFEGPFGFIDTLGVKGESDPNRMLENLGNPWNIVGYPGLGIKPYASCGETHRCIDASLYIRSQEKFQADKVEEIICQTSDLVPKVLIHSRPTSELEAKFSMEYCVAVSLIDGKAGLDQFTDQRVRSADVQQLLQKVHFQHPEELRGERGMRYVPPEGATGPNADDLILPETVIVRLKDGRQFSHSVKTPKGRAKNRLTKSEIRSKYRDCAKHVLSETDISRSLEMLDNLQGEPTISNLTQILRGNLQRS